MLVQMEKFIHVLQVTAGRKDGDGHYNLTIADELAIELDAKKSKNQVLACNIWN